MNEQNILVSGCSGGGKSTLVAALAARGYRIVPEPGRRIVAAELSAGGTALPWLDMQAFARRAFDLARADLAAATGQDGCVFFDRGLIDAAVAWAHAGGPPYAELLGPVRAYAKRVFLAPPWPEIFETDAERRHGMTEAQAEYLRLAEPMAVLGYEAVELPRVPVPGRADFVLRTLGLA